MATVDGKSANGKAAEAEEGGFYDDIENLKKLCDFLRSKEGPAVREAVEMDKRVYYLKGPLFKEFFLFSLPHRASFMYFFLNYVKKIGNDRVHNISGLRSSPTF